MSSLIDFTKVPNRRGSPLSWLKLGLLLATILVPLAWSVWLAFAAQRTWTGFGISNPNPALRNLWSTNQNWDTGAPQAFDNLSFPSSVQINSNNDFANGTTFNTISISGPHIMTGHSISLNAGITATNGQISLTSITLNNSQVFNAPTAGASVVIASPIDNNGKTLTLNGPGALSLFGIISGNGGLTKQGTGTMTLGGANTYKGQTSINQGTLVVNGDQTDSSVIIAGGGTLAGVGTVGDVIVDNSSGTISPGAPSGGTGILTLNEALRYASGASASSFNVDLNGTTPGSGYDQVDVKAFVFLSGTPAVGNPALNVTLGFSPQPGNSFTILKNGSPSVTLGEFAGHPEGSSFTVNSTIFVITYKGGDGNDVVLHVPELKQWTGGGPNNLWTTGSNWVGGNAPQAADDLDFPGGASKLTNVNDFPPGTLFRQIAINGSGYHLQGGGLSLMLALADFSSSANNSVEFASLGLSGGQKIGRIGTGTLAISSQIITSGLFDLEGSVFLGGGITGAGGMRDLSGSVTVGGNSNNNFSGQTLVSSGTLTVFASLPNSPVAINGGVLTGTKTVKSIFASGGTIFQDYESGAFTSTGDVSLNAAASFRTQLFHFGSTTANGSLNVGGALVLGNSTLIADPNFSQAPPAGTTFKIINKTSVGTVHDTFNNLPEGALLAVGVAVLRISYVGGDGNDVTLTAPSTRTWDGGGTTNNWTEAANWVGDVAPGSGDDLIFPAGAARMVNNNDFPAGTTFNSISFSGAPYTLGGNAIALNTGISDSAPGQNSIQLASIKLNDNQTFSKAGSAILQINTPIDTNGKTLTLDGAGTKAFGGAISGAGGLTVNGTGLVVNGGVSSTFTGSTVVNSGKFVLDAGQANSQLLLNGGEFFGRSGVKSIVATGGTIHCERGFTPSSNNVTLSSAVTFDVGLQRNSTSATSGTFFVNGAIDLGNSTLTVDPIFLVTPAAGDTFTIIRKTGAGAVQGTFNNLPEGALLTAGGALLRISYIGGDGNDVTLTVPTTRRWDGGSAVNSNWQTKENWEGDLAPMPGDDLVFPAGAARLQNNNDFAAGTTFNSITFSDRYFIDGNSIALSAGITATNPSAAGPVVRVPIKLNADQTFASTNVNASLGFSSSAPIDNQGHLLTLAGAGDFVLSSQITGTGGLTKTGQGLATAGTNNTYTGVTTVSSGTLLVFGNQPSSPVNMTGGTISGTGTAGILTANGGTINPGAIAPLQTGVLNVQGDVSLSSAASLSVELRGTTVGQGNPPGSGYDQLNVIGNVNIGGSILNVLLSGSFTPAPGNTLVVINNDGLDSVTGTFAGLPEGGTLISGSQRFKISYVGGDGNDVVLTADNAPRRQLIDYDVDGKTDIGIFRPSNGAWFLLKSATGYDPAQFLGAGWGGTGDVPVTGDYDGDGKADIVIYRPSNGGWYILRSTANYNPAAFTLVGWGGDVGDVAVPADYDGDGLTDIAIFRPSNGGWYILKSSTNYNPAQFQLVGWGNAGDVPVPGDYDGDGKTDIAIFRPSNGGWYILKSSTNYNPAQFQLVGWGNAGDTPAPADYDGDSKADIAIYRASDGGWYILKSTTNYNPAQFQLVGWGGGVGDVPVPADYDGDGKAEIAIYRPSDGGWYILKSTTNYNPAQFLLVGWGGNAGDVPLSNLVR